MNQLSFIIFSMVLDHCGYERPCLNLALASTKYEFIYIHNSQKVPYRTYCDYLNTKYSNINL